MKKLLNAIIVLIIFSMIACKNNPQDKGKNIQIDSTKQAKEPASKDTSANNGSSTKDEGLYCVKEKLSDEEKLFLGKLKSENNSIIYFNEVNRYYARKDNRPAFSQVIIPPDSLTNEGYVYFDFTFWGDLSDLHILYSFNQGAALCGDGSVIGEDTTNYFHTVVTYTTTGYGTTGKHVALYSNGQKLCTHEYAPK